MKFLSPTVLALAAMAAPKTAGAWSIIPRSYFTAPLVIPSPSSILREQQALANRMLEQTDRLFQQPFGSTFSSPKYELVDNDEKFQLSVDVPGVKQEDLDISLEEGYLTVRGQRTVENENSKFSSKFSQTFSLDPALDVDKLTASLSNGVLVVSAPKDMKKIESNVRKIPIAATEPQQQQLSAQTQEYLEDLKKPEDVAVLPKELDETDANTGDKKMEELTA